MHRVWPLVFRLPGMSLPLPSPAVTGLGFPVARLLCGNAAAASDYYRGRFAMGGSEATAGRRGIFDEPAPGEGWAAALHGFAWLADLEAGGLELYRIFARSLVDGWIERRRLLPRAARQPATAARRLMSFTIHGSFLTRGAPEAFHGRLCRMLTAEFAALSTASRGLREPRERLAGATALAYACSGLRGLEGLAGPVFARLEAEIETSILADGGPLSRNPAQLVEALLDLMPLKQALASSRRQVPARLGAAIERMLPMLRLLSHGDGGLAVFQGVQDLEAARVRAILEDDPVQGRPLLHAAASGYARLAHSGALIVVDAGEARACAGPLAFEFSDGPCRIVVNCGLPSRDAEDLLEAASSIAAHSTADFGWTSRGRAGAVSRITGWGRADRTRALSAEAAATPNGSLFRGLNPRAAPGLSHERRLYLAARGDDLRGEDRFMSDDPGTAAPFTIRFHLHPSIRAVLSKDGAGVTLAAANKTGWQFSARGAAIGLEDSVFFPASPRRSQQITLTGDLATASLVNWAFKRIDRRDGQKSRGQASPALPF